MTTRAAHKARPLVELVWVVVSVDQKANQIVVRDATPRPGEPVQTRSFVLNEWSGYPEPRPGAIVRSAVRVDAFDPRWRLDEWLRALHKRVSASRGLTLARLRTALRDASEDDERWMRGAWTTADLSAVLQIASRATGKASQAHWLYADDWRWSRERTQRAFERMLELPPDAVRPRPLDDDEPLSEYADRCNRAAEERACERRLFQLGPIGDDHVFVAVGWYEYTLLVRDGLVRPWG